jgi:NitT/TauT family transport system substrate-binding protein
MTQSDRQTPSLSRRNVLKVAGTAGLAATAGVIGGRVLPPAIAGPAPKIRLAWGDIAACHSPLGFGVAKGLYAKHNLDVELYPFTSNGQTVIQALATGKADAGAGLIGDWLKPLEQGFDVKLFVGSHGGCGRLFASEKSGVKDLKDLKGKTIATFVMGASPQTVLQVSIFKAGLDPNADVN